jgi:hypothetical protein
MPVSRAYVKLSVLLGIGLGLAIGAGVVYLRHAQRSQLPGPPHGALLSECDGALRRLVIQCAAADDTVAIPTYRSFLPQLPAGVEVLVVCPDRKVFEALVKQVGPTAATLTPVLADHPMTSWSRDRWLALIQPPHARPSQGGDNEKRTTLLCPAKEDGADIWPQRQGDQQVAFDLAQVLGNAYQAHRSELNFDGGDFAADRQTVFVRPSVALRNVQHTARDRAELTEMLSKSLEHKVVWLDGAPDHHVGMYMMPIGQRTVLVGDPRWAENLLAQAAEEKQAVEAFCPGGPDFSPVAISAFEKVVEECEAAGYRVVRIPVVPGGDSRTYLTFVNGIQDERDGRHTIYMPTYSFAPTLNRAAAAVWAELGFDVKNVDCDACARNFGTLHCLVNVLARD